MKRYALFYPFLNGVFHVVHIFIIIFVMVGWAFPLLRLVHLALTLLTLGSWFILGQWLGIGYCPISDWHWKIKTAIGEGQPSGTYINHLLQTIARRELNSETVDKTILIGTVAITAISLALNVRAWLT
ncbi:DUF2784 family protein [Serratia marcescens]|uniref:DUF2784 family protein n=1 Tax=Serratia marcescens TaxID=615 RepID=UPI0002B87A94|nr:DUF2784 family protein [Serratia marcescens]EMF07334.1 hypothetical protein F518_02752 [Serratia marcescens VGH107]